MQGQDQEGVVINPALTAAASADAVAPQPVPPEAPAADVAIEKPAAVTARVESAVVELVETIENAVDAFTTTIADADVADVTDAEPTEKPVSFISQVFAEHRETCASITENIRGISESFRAEEKRKEEEEKAKAAANAGTAKPAEAAA